MPEPTISFCHPPIGRGGKREREGERKEEKEKRDLIVTLYGSLIPTSMWVSSACFMRTWPFAALAHWHAGSFNVPSAMMWTPRAIPQDPVGHCCPTSQH